MSSLAKVVSLMASAFVHATEDTGKVAQAIRNIAQPQSLGEPEVTHSKGHHGNQITTLVVTLNNSNSALSCLRIIWSQLSILDKNTIFSDLASRVNDSGTLFLRVDKQQAYMRTIRLQDSDPIKIEISFRTYRSKQVEVVTDIQNLLTAISGNVSEPQ